MDPYATTIFPLIIPTPPSTPPSSNSSQFKTCSPTAIHKVPATPPPTVLKLKRCGPMKLSKRKQPPKLDLKVKSKVSEKIMAVDPKFVDYSVTVDLVHTNTAPLPAIPIGKILLIFSDHGPIGQIQSTTKNNGTTSYLITYTHPSSIYQVQKHVQKTNSQLRQVINMENSDHRYFYKARIGQHQLVLWQIGFCGGLKIKMSDDLVMVGLEVTQMTVPKGLIGYDNRMDGTFDWEAFERKEKVRMGSFESESTIDEGSTGQVIQSQDTTSPRNCRKTPERIPIPQRKPIMISNNASFIKYHISASQAKPSSREPMVWNSAGPLINPAGLSMTYAVKDCPLQDCPFNGQAHYNPLPATLFPSTYLDYTQRKYIREPIQATELPMWHGFDDLLHKKMSQGPVPHFDQQHVFVANLMSQEVTEMNTN